MLSRTWNCGLLFPASPKRYGLVEKSNFLFHMLFARLDDSWHLLLFLFPLNSNMVIKSNQNYLKCWL